MDKKQLGDQPIEQKYADQMRAIAQTLDEVFNGDKKGREREVGFCLMVFPLNKFVGRANYVSNADRDGVIELLKAQLKKFEENKNVTQ